MAVDASGNLYITENANHKVLKVTPTGSLSTFAGVGIFGFAGDGGPATSAGLYHPSGVAVDASGNVYIADSFNNRVRKVNTSGIISTVAGTGVSGYSGDGGQATAAQLKFIWKVAVDISGNLYIDDEDDHRIRKVNTLGIISTFAGTGVYGYSGDGGPAASAQLNYPNDVCVDAIGNVFVADRQNNRVREICIGACPLGINSLSEIDHKILVFPNPNNGSFKLQIENEIENCELILINFLGQKFHEQKISQGENNIITNGLAKGLYNYIVLRDKEQIGSGKLAIE